MSRIFLVKMIIVGLLVLSSATTNAQERLIEYVVVKGDTCEGIARKLYGSPKYCYKMLAKYNKFDARYKLEPGQILNLPTREDLDRSPDAELAERRGAVEARKPDESRWFAASLGERLWSRWRVSTEQRSSARVQFIEDRSSLELRESTLVIIYGPRTSTIGAKAGARAELERGALRSRLGELSGKPASVTVETPAARAAQTGGEALVTVEAKGGTTRVANHTGKKVTVSGYDPIKKKASKKKVVLPVNTGSKVEVGKDPTPPRPLPAPPSWVSTSPIIAETADESGVVEVEWTAVSQVSNVRLELSRREDGSELVDAQLVPGALSRARFEGLPVGEYWVRLAAIDDDGFEGLVGPARRIVLNKRRVLTPRFEGRADGAPVLPGDVLALDGMRCGLDGQEPASRLVMPRAGRFEVSCVGEGGEAQAPLVVEVAPVAVSQVAPSDAVVAAPAEAVEVSFLTSPAVDALSVEPPAGWSVTQAPTRDGARWRVTVVPAAGAQPGPLLLIAGAGGEIGGVPLAVAAGSDGDVSGGASGAQPWSVQPLFSYSALYSGGYRFDDRAVSRGWRVGARLGRELGGGLSLEAEAHVGRLIVEGERADRISVAGGQLGGVWRMSAGLSPFVSLGTGAELGLGELEGALWTVGAGVGLLSPVSEQLHFKLELREVIAPLVDGGPGLQTQAGFGLMLRF